MSEQGNGGYIRLFRKLLEHPIWTQLAPAVAKVAIYFLLHANYRPTRWYDGVAASKYRPARSLRASKKPHSPATFRSNRVEMLLNTWREHSSQHTGEHTAGPW